MEVGSLVVEVLSVDLAVEVGDIEVHLRRPRVVQYSSSILYTVMNAAMVIMPVSKQKASKLLLTICVMVGGS